jgi:hypothetical protein
MQAYIYKYSLLFAILLICIGCKDPVLTYGPAQIDAPVILSPANNSEYGFEDRIVITWKGDSSASFFESQFMSNTEKFYTESDASLFDSYPLFSSQIHDNNYNFSFKGTSTQIEYCGFRIRQIIHKDTSKWSKIISIACYPLGTMNKTTITFNSVYNFTSQYKPTYYSGLVNGNYLNMDSALAIIGLNAGNIITIKPNQGKIYYEGNSGVLTDFNRLVFGIGTQPYSVWPFDVIADTYIGGTSTPTLTFYPYGGTERNFKDFFALQNPQINMAYFLTDTTKINISNKITAVIGFDVYYK